jgi:hypothetical protein
MAVIRILLDTNAIAEPVRPIPNAGFMKRLRTNEGLRVEDWRTYAAQCQCDAGAA